jgi:hypothetical protein
MPLHFVVGCPGHLTQVTLRNMRTDEGESNLTKTRMYPVFPPTNLTRITLLPFAVDRRRYSAYSPVLVRPLFISTLKCKAPIP